MGTNLILQLGFVNYWKICSPIIELLLNHHK